MTSISIIGFAAKPGTAVLPTCSIPIAKSLKIGHTLARMLAKTSGHSAR